MKDKTEHYRKHVQSEFKSEINLKVPSSALASIFELLCSYFEILYFSDSKEFTPKKTNTGLPNNFCVVMGRALDIKGMKVLTVIGRDCLKLFAPGQENTKMHLTHPGYTGQGTLLQGS